VVAGWALGWGGWGGGGVGGGVRRLLVVNGPRIHARRVSPGPTQAPSTDKRAPHAYVYSPISAGALRHFLHRYGGGDRAVAWVAERQIGRASCRERVELWGVAGARGKQNDER